MFEIYAREDIVGKEGTVWFHKDDLVDTITTTANGADENPEELHLGKYYVKEKSAPSGYVFDDVEYDVELKYKDDKTAIIIEKIEAGNRYLKVDLSAYKVKTHVVPDELESGMIHQKEIQLPAEGIVFGLYTKNALHGLDGDSVEADTCIAVAVTDAEGYMDFNGYVPHGDYYIKELQTVGDWILNEEKFNVSLTPDKKLEDKELISVRLESTIDNKPDVKEITITKTTITGDETVPGALIELYDSEGNVIYREYTNENGEIPEIKLMPGKYTFKEILAPEGYELNVAVLEFEVTKEGEIIGTTEIRDDYTRVKFRKVDSLDGRAVEGAEFTLYNEEHKAILTAVSDADGLVVFEKIPYGTFTIEETKAADGYDLREGSVCKAFVVDGKFINDKGEPQNVNNTPNTFVVKKVDQDGKPLAGAEFGLFNEDGEAIQTAVSDKDGIVTFRRILKGKYTIRETKAVEGYLLCKKVYNLTVDDNFKSVLEPTETFVNHLKRIKYIKVETSGKYLEGVEFSLIDKATGKVVEVVTSDEKGVFTFTKFDYGDWIVRETKAPEGYNIMEDVEFHVGDDWTEPAPVTCIDIPNHYEFVKTDTSGRPLAGATFVLETKDGKEVGTFTSGSDGIVHVTDMKPGEYVIREITAPDGFNRSDEHITVVVDEHYIVPEEMYHLCNIPNHYEFVKTDTAGNPLAGVVFALEDLKGNKLGNFTSGEDGIVHVTDLAPGTYIIREITTLEGFNRTDETIKVVVDEHYIVPEEMYHLCNIPNHFEFVKTDNQGNPMPGVKFTLEDEAGNLLGEYVSDENGIVRVTDLTPGKYVIREIETLEGFVLSDEPIVVTIDEHYIVPKEMYTLVNYPVIKTGTEISSPYLWVGVGLLALALAAGVWVFIHAKKRKTNAK